MTVTFSDAVSAVRALRVSTWGITVGTPFVYSDGYEVAEDHLVVWGTAEYLRNGDDTCAILNDTATFVLRDSGDARDQRHPRDRIPGLAAVESEATAPSRPPEGCPPATYRAPRDTRHRRR